ncbi:MAG: DMT family transporter [Nocardiopsaceae bacterium]|jgi:drug/metabolite transporter (DMT)-like permease|nr:DMT family transporter [Nocardiopsaceae bacterium]
MDGIDGTDFRRRMSGAGVQPVAIALAATAAATFAVANVVQQRVAASLQSAAAFDGALLLRLIRRPLWVAGLAAVAVSLALQATALDLGRLVVIEPVLASSLLFALALGAWADHRRMRPVEWLAALATFAGLVVFLSVARPSGGEPTAAPSLLGLAALAAVAAAVISGLLATRMSPLRRALTLGVGGGIAAGVTDALTKTVAALFGAHQLGALADARPYLLVFIGLLTYTMQQNGYRAAGLAAFLPVFSVLDPAVGSLLGIVLYHEHLGGGAWRIAAEVAAVLAATWGISQLARSTAKPEPAEPVAERQRAELATASVSVADPR